MHYKLNQRNLSCSFTFIFQPPLFHIGHMILTPMFEVKVILDCHHAITMMIKVLSWFGKRSQVLCMWGLLIVQVFVSCLDQLCNKGNLFLDCRPKASMQCKVWLANTSQKLKLLGSGRHIYLTPLLEQDAVRIHTCLPKQCMPARLTYGNSASPGFVLAI